MGTLIQDVRYAVRGLRKTPAFTAVAVATLALGIGANTAIFTLVDRVLLGLLPVARPRELVLLRSPGENPGHTWSDDDAGTSFSYPMYRDLRDRNRALAGLAGVFPFDASVASGTRTEPANGELVTGNYFDLLGVSPYLGRVLVPSDDTVAGGHPLVVLSYAFYRRRFGGDSAILNKTLTINGTPLTVVGVARPEFDGVQRGRPADLFVPVTMKAAMTFSWSGLDDPRDHWLQLIGRLRRGESIAHAEASLNVLYHALLVDLLPQIRRWRADEQRHFLERRLELLPGGRGRLVLQNGTRAPLVALMGMVGAVLLIACSNLAGLLLARGAARRRENGIRLAVGGNGRDLFRQTLVESLVLAVAGGAAAVFVATAALRALIGALPADADLRRIPASVDLPVLMFTLGVSLASGLFFGLVPAWRAAALDPNRVLRGSSGPASGDGIAFRKWLVTGQIALTLALLVGAGLFSRSLHNLSTVDLGLKPDRVLEFSIDPRLAGYTPERTSRLASALSERLAGLPGVRSVSADEFGPFQGDDSSGDLSIAGTTMSPGTPNHVRRNFVGPDYFATLGVPLLSGREFGAADRGTAPPVAVVNETLVRRLFPGRNPIGTRIGFGRSDEPPNAEIVGVVADSRSEVDEPTPPFAYFPYLQDSRLRHLTFYVRTAEDSRAAAAAVRTVVSRFDPNLPTPDVRTLRSQIEDSIARQRLIGALSIVFAGLAALLAGIGIYGVLAYSVARRTPEIGVRMAVGATAGEIRRLVLADVVRFVLVGGAVGLPIAYGVARGVASLLFGVRAADPAAFAAGAAAVAGAALLAGYLPARRASRIDPMRALRDE
jgi:predicted permease